MNIRIMSISKNVRVVALAALVTASTTMIAPSVAVAATPAPVTGTTVASWPMRETSGTTAYDTTGRGHTATLYAGKPSFKFTYDTALSRYVGDFPSDNGLLLVNANTDMSPGKADFAIGTTFKTLDGHSNILQAGTTQVGKDFIKLEMASAHSAGLVGVPRCRFTGDVSRNVGGFILLGDKSYADGKWHTVRCDKHATKIVMRIDGIVVNERAVTVGSVNVSLEKWSIGGKYTPNQTTSTSDMYKGQLRDTFVRIVK